MDLASYAGSFSAETTTTEICVLEENPFALPDNRLRLEMLRAEILYYDEAGLPKVKIPAFSAYLVELFKPVTVSGVLWVYDRKTGLYKQNDHYVEAEIQRVLDAMLYRGPVVSLKKDLVSRLTDYRVVEESPFDLVAGIPALDCVVEPGPDGGVSLIPYGPSLFVRVRAATRFADAPESFPEGERFFREISCDDPEWVRDVFRVLGYCLLRGNPSQKFFVLHGSGGNGKGVLIEWVMRAVGQLAGRVAPRELFCGNRAERETTLAGNAHRRLLVVSEAGGGVLNDDLLKRVTGDAAVMLNAIYAGEREYVMCGTLVFVTNSLPVFSSGGKGMMRREVCIPFDLDVAPDAQDEELLERLATPEGNRWLLSKMVAGALEYVRAESKSAFWGSLCARIRGDSREVLAGQDSLGEFVRVCLVREEGARTPGREVFARWYAWEFGDEQEVHEARGGRGLRRNVSAAELYAGLRMRGVEVRKRMRVGRKLETNVLMDWRLGEDS
ncbi:hypothetical protein O0S10_08470 [Methanocorpusculum sp. MG]|uniref:SF3 helicase domain-containing protein n=1 Tax=Methanocorpusculum petauri TaxID=3002863 RepID=A0ABT4IHN4_9EURY|nr:DUF5906 domain-containing protein [Methanocorpusculum petauri]MCZ0861251.1 hypothetical protein [Methanocorpusculum petauri]